jgi:hypothetical protein
MKCPKCGKEMSECGNDTFACEENDCSFGAATRQYLELTPDKFFMFGKIKPYGKTGFALNTSNGKFIFTSNKSSLFHYNLRSFGPYTIADILDVQVTDDAQLIYQTSNGLASTIAGGVLFGAVGAVAGSMAAGKKTKVSSKDKFIVSLRINDIKFAGLSFSSEDRQTVFDFISTLELLQKKSSQTPEAKK